MSPPTCKRRTGLAVLGDMPWGSHCCHFFQTRKDLVETLVPFFKTGLESKEFCPSREPHANAGRAQPDRAGPVSTRSGGGCCPWSIARKPSPSRGRRLTVRQRAVAGRGRMAWRVFRANKTCPRCRALSGRLARSSREFRARISKLLIAADGAAPR